MQGIPEGFIRCPACKGDFLKVVAGVALCPACGAEYPLVQGVPDLVPELTFKKTIAQRTMETPAVVKMYESRFWRRAAVLGFFLGIPFDRELALIFEAAGLAEDGTLLDIACGPGIYTRPFARRLVRGRVAGLDLSKPMLGHAVELARRDGLSNTVFVRASAQDLPFPDSSFSAVNCCGALHLFPDPAKAVREAARVLAPGGSYTVAMARNPETFVTRPVKEFLDRVVGVRSLGREELSGLFVKAGLGAPEVLHEKGFWLIVAGKKPL
jgi:SAM-dependent methyltransferase